MLRFFLLLMITMSVALDSQKYVVVEVKSQSSVVENGKPFFLFFIIKAVSGVHLNAQPPISIKPIGDTTTIKIKGVTEQKSGEYLDVSKPIEVECRLNGAEAASRKLSFEIGYTYCSEKDGWCRMGKDTVSVTVRVKK